MAAKKMGELLVRDSLITIDQLEEARKEQKNTGGRLYSVLVQKGYVDEKEMSQFIGAQYNLPTVDLEQFQISEDIIKLMPKNFCEKYSVIPVSKSSRTLVVAFSDPSDVYVKDDISLLTKCKVTPVISSEKAIKAAIERYYGSSAGIESLNTIMSEMQDLDENDIVTDDSEFVDMSAGGAEAPVIKFVNAMLIEAIKLKASDIHVEQYEKRFRIRFRIDGVLYEKTQPPQGVAAAVVSRLKVISKMDIAERRRPQDGRLKIKLKNGLEIDFRVSSLPTLFGEKIVLRILDKSNLQVDMDTLGLEPELLEIVKSILAQPQGMILVTGPTGSGKTTTLYSALAHVNSPKNNISTAENPVEYNFDGINQVQINHEIGFTFAMALRSFLRQDPDIIMLGEIRDYETAEIAFKAASTGHLVLSTLHTNDSPSTITRLVEMGMAPYLVAETVSIVIAQRLIKKICSHCKVRHNVDEMSLTKAGVKDEDLSKYTELYKGEGCEHCNSTGLSGRRPVFEVMPMSLEIREGILKGKTQLELKRIAMDNGVSTLRQSALLLLQRGEVSLAEVLNVSVGDDL